MVWTREVKSEPPADIGAGFSLIEVLVVLSIVSLLVSVLLPVVGRARESARQAVCQNQLRQWGLAFEAYSVGSDGFYPHIDGLDRQGDVTFSTSLPTKDQADFFGWVDMLPPLMGEKPWREHEVGQYPGTGMIFQCPSSQLAPQELYSYRPMRNGYFSYAMNSCLELDENCWPPYNAGGGASGANDMPSFLNTGLIRCPQRVVLLFDQLLDPLEGYDGKLLNRSAGQHCGSYPKAFSVRHRRSRSALGGHVLYCDYHVQWVESVWKSDWPEDLEVPPRRDKDWYPY